MIVLNNDYNERLTINIECEGILTPRIVMTFNSPESSERIFLLNSSNIEDLRTFFIGDYNFYTEMPKWLNENDKEVICKEHLNHLLSCAESIKQKCLRERDALVTAINKLDSILDIYKGE